MKNSVFTLFVTCHLLVSASAAYAQPVRGTIQGLVLDATGAVVPGAQVVVTSDTTAVRHSVRSDDRGWFVVTPLDPGAYHVEVTHTGFRKHAQAFTLQVNQRFRLDVVAPARTDHRNRHRDGASGSRPYGNFDLVSFRSRPDREPAARRPQLPGAGAADGRRRAVRAGLGGVGPRRLHVERQRRARRLQYVPARRRLQLRPEVEYGCGAAAGRCDSRVRGHRQHARRVLRQRRRCAGERRHAVRRQPRVGDRLRVLAHQGLQREELLRSRKRAVAGIPAPSVRRIDRRTDCQRPRVLLRGLRGHAAVRRHHPRDQCADAGGAVRRFFGEPVYAADRPGVRRAVPQQPDSGRRSEPDRPRARRALPTAQPRGAVCEFRLIA